MRQETLNIMITKAIIIGRIIFSLSLTGKSAIFFLFIRLCIIQKEKVIMRNTGKIRVMQDYGLQNVIIGDSIIKSTDLIRRKWMSNDFYGLVFSLKYQKERLEATVGGGLNQYLGDHFGKIIWMRICRKY